MSTPFTASAPLNPLVKIYMLNDTRQLTVFWFTFTQKFSISVRRLNDCISHNLCYL